MPPRTLASLAHALSVAPDLDAALVALGEGLAEIDRSAHVALLRYEGRREMLAERLMRSVNRAPLTQVEEAWVKEAERRFAAWRRGEREGVPAEKAFKQIRKDFGW